MIHAVVYAKDFDGLLAFYEGLGFTRGEVEPNDFAFLDKDGAELAIVQIPDHISRNIEITDPPGVRADTPIKLAFVVDSIEAALNHVRQAGGGSDDFKPWSRGEYRYQDCIDPEGNVLQLREKTA